MSVSTIKAKWKQKILFSIYQYLFSKQAIANTTYRLKVLNEGNTIGFKHKPKCYFEQSFAEFDQLFCVSDTHGRIEDNREAVCNSINLLSV